jgi:outer membrane receptor protein involved in Fe transport
MTTTNTSCHRVLAWWLACAAPWPLIAQSLPDRAAVDAGASGDVVQLSPFVVQVERDTGYRSQSTLAGTRLNTPISDLGASISVFTRDLIADLGATSSADLLIYGAGTEAAGAGGNFSASTNNINATEIVGEGPRAAPQNSNRTRGLASSQLTRGFFNTDIGLDSYNTESVTLSRGPNAILFGAGSPAGVLEQSLIRADLFADSTRVEYRYGNNDSHRASLDVNRVLWRNTLAVRLAALEDRERFNQRPAYEDKQRLFGTFTYQPTRTTVLRGNFETGHTRANRPITTLPFRSYDEFWFAEGRPVVDWRDFDDPAINPNAAQQTPQGFVGLVPLPGSEGYTMGQGQTFTSVAYFYDQPDAQAVSRSLITQINNISGFNPVNNRDGNANDGIRWVGTLNRAEMSANYWVYRNIPGGRPPGLKMQGFTDFAAFDFKNRMIDETSRQWDSFRTVNLALEQRAWQDRVGVELAFDRQRYDRHAKNGAFSSANGNHIRIDTSVRLPDGTLNPNVGRPYVVMGNVTAWQNYLAQRETFRGTAYLRYDFADASERLGHWLGSHTLTGLAEQTTVDLISYQHRLASMGIAADVVNSGTIIGSYGRRPNVVVYMGPSVLDGSPVQLSPIRIPELTDSLSATTVYFDRDTQTYRTAVSTTREVNNGGAMSREVIQSEAVVLHSYWLERHLVTLVGWRRDEDYFARRNLPFPNGSGIANEAAQQVHYGFEDFTFPRRPNLQAAAEIKTYSGVLRWPQRLMRLPDGMDGSVFYNNSGNFTPQGARLDPFGNPIASPRGKTEEYGFNLSFLHDRFSLRLGRFETSIQNASFSNNLVNFIGNNGIAQIAQFWAQEANINPGFDRSAEIDLLFSAIPEFRTVYDFRVAGTAPNITANFTTPPSRSDLTDFVAKGYELEVVYNPTRNWRLLANVARQQTVQTNLMPFTKDLIARQKPVWDQLAHLPRFNYPAGHVLGDPLPPTVDTLGAWLQREIYIPFAAATASEGSASAEQRKWRANLVANYSFGRETVLRGWNVGTGIRWQDKLGLGYPTSFNPDGTVRFDLDNPFYAPAETNVDAWLGYTRRLWNDRVNWRVQLNVRNLVGDSGTIGVTAQPDGSTAIARLAPERRWYLTNTFSF